MKTLFSTILLGAIFLVLLVFVAKLALKIAFIIAIIATVSALVYHLFLKDNNK